MRRSYPSLLPLTLLIFSVCLNAEAQTPTLVSINSSNASTGNNTSKLEKISADGRFVVFTSNASDLVAGDTNNAVDIFVRDLTSGTTRLVSINSSNTASANGASTNPSISADGRYVAFQSTARNLAAFDGNDTPDIFVRDLVTDTTTLVSINNRNTSSGSDESILPAISADGRLVAFVSKAYDLVLFPSQLANTYDVYVRDLTNRTTSAVSINRSGTSTGNADCAPATPVISDDNRYIVFFSRAIDLVPNSDPNLQFDIYARDLQTNTTALVSVNTSGMAGGIGEVYFNYQYPFTTRISRDGRFIAFASYAKNFVPNEKKPSLVPDIYLRDMIANVTTLVSSPASPNSTSGAYSLDFDMSADGRFIVFGSGSTNLVPGGSSHGTNIFVRDTTTGTTTLASAESTGATGGNNSARRAAISGDGRFVVFTSQATNLIAPSSTYRNVDNVFVRDLTTRRTIQLTNTTELPSTNGASEPVTIAVSQDGTIVGFATADRNLYPNDFNSTSDVFAYGINQDVPLTASVNDTVTVEDDNGNPAGATFTVQLSRPAAEFVSVDYSTVAASAGSFFAPAQPGDDFTPLSGTLTFAPGMTTQTLSVPITPDALEEPDEFFNLVLTNGVGVPIADGHAAALILNDDMQPTISIGDARCMEGDGGTSDCVFAIALSVPSGRDTGVSVNTTGTGTARFDIDYFLPDRTITIPAGTTSVNFVVKIRGDVFDEGDETFDLQISSQFTTDGDIRATGTIIDEATDTSLPLLSVQDAQATEQTPGGADHLRFSVRLSASDGRAVSVNYVTSDGTARAGEDYFSASGTLTFAPGETEKIVPIQVREDQNIESDETVTITLSSPVNATLLRAQATGIIFDNDTPYLYISDRMTVGETDGGASTLTLTVRLIPKRPAGAETVTVDYATREVTATGGVDFTPTSGTLAFAPGEDIKTIQVTYFGDTLSESDEIFEVVLSNPTVARIYTTKSEITIRDNDPLPSISINDVIVREGVYSDTVAVLNVSLSTISGSSVTINYLTFDGTAVGRNPRNADYKTTTGTIVIPAGELQRTITIPIHRDYAAEPDEFFAVRLLNVWNASITDGEGQIVIINAAPKTRSFVRRTRRS